jgi:hypothetical protein
MTPASEFLVALIKTITRIVVSPSVGSKPDFRRLYHNVEPGFAGSTRG